MTVLTASLIAPPVRELALSCIRSAVACATGSKRRRVRSFATLLHANHTPTSFTNPAAARDFCPALSALPTCPPSELLACLQDILQKGFTRAMLDSAENPADPSRLLRLLSGRQYNAGERESLRALLSNCLCHTAQAIIAFKRPEQHAPRALNMTLTTWNLSSLRCWEGGSSSVKTRTISALLAKGPVCFQETNWTVRDVERASVTFPRAAVISTLAVPNGSSGVTILVPAPFKVESQHEVLPGYVLSVEISHFTHKCEIVSVYAHADRFQEVSAALQTYLAARNTQVELFVAGDFNSMREKQPALWDLFVSEGLLKQVSLHVDTYRSGPHASQLDLILHNEHAEGARKLTSRVFWPRSIPNGHALVSLRACKARLLANDVRAVKYSAIPLRAFKQHATAPTSGIPSRPAHPAQLRLLRMRYLVSHKPSLADLQGLFHLWWKREMPSHNLAVQEGLLGALPYLLRRQRLQPRAQDYLIPRNIYETFRHLLSDHRWSEDGRAARLTAVEMQQVVSQLTVLEIAQLSPPSCCGCEKDWRQASGQAPEMGFT